MEKLLELFTRFSILVKDAFSDDPRFLTSRDKVSSYSLFLEILVIYFCDVLHLDNIYCGTSITVPICYIISFRCDRLLITFIPIILLEGNIGCSSF